jgi:hypothetical protein
MSFIETRGALRVLAGKSAGQSLGKIESVAPNFGLTLMLLASDCLRV